MLGIIDYLEIAVGRNGILMTFLTCAVVIHRHVAEGTLDQSGTLVGGFSVLHLIITPYNLACLPPL